VINWKKLHLTVFFESKPIHEDFIEVKLHEKFQEEISQKKQYKPNTTLKIMEPGRPPLESLVHC